MGCRFPAGRCARSEGYLAGSDIVLVRSGRTGSDCVCDAEISHDAYGHSGSSQPSARRPTVAIDAYRRLSPKDQPRRNPPAVERCYREHELSRSVPALFNQDDLIRLRLAAGIDRLKPGITGWGADKRARRAADTGKGGLRSRIYGATVTLA